MDHATQVALMRRIFAFLDGRTTELADEPLRNPVATYTSEAQLARERQRLFRREPLFLGLSCDLPGPGTYLATSDSGVPILAVRTRTGELRAFIAICRHRGAQVVDDGVGSHPGRFSCPYHGWTYDDAGRLIGQPCEEGFAGLSRDTLGLTALPIAERHGMIFVRPTPGAAIDIDAHLGGAQRELEPLGLEHYQRFARREIERAMNWKLVIDTFLEAYHVSSLHVRSLGPAIFGSPAAWDAFGCGGRLVAARRSIADVRRRPESDWNLYEHSVVLYQLFPNTMLIYQVDHVEIVQAFPAARGADAAKIVFTIYTPSEVIDDRARRHFQSNFDLLLEVTDREDFRICEQMQRGFHVDETASVVYGRNEPGLAHYHRMIRQALE